MIFLRQFDWRTDGEATTFKATARVLSGDSPLELVKTSGLSHGGEHSAAVKMEASNPCINETDKVQEGIGNVLTW